MTYTAKSVDTLRKIAGSLLSKIQAELSLIDTELDTIEADDWVTSARCAPGFMKVVVENLATGMADDILLAWENPETGKIVVHRVMIDIYATAGSGTPTIDVGSAATATTESTNLMNGVSTGTVDVIDNLGIADASTTTNVKLDENGGNTAYLTFTAKDADAISIGATAIIMYTALGTE